MTAYIATFHTHLSALLTCRALTAAGVAAWVQRLAHYASEKQSSADSSASGSIKLAKERIELMKRYGIMD